MDFLKQHTAYSDRPILPRAKQIDGCDAGHRTYFMKNRSSVSREEVLYLLQRCRAQFFEDAQSKRLRNGRIDPVKGSIGSGAFRLLGAAVWKEPLSGFDEFNARVSFGPLQTPG
jgi:hypothetical protein